MDDDQSFTAKVAKDAKEQKSLTAEVAKDAKEPIISIEPREREGNAKGAYRESSGSSFRLHPSSFMSRHPSLITRQSPRVLCAKRFIAPAH
jgi:hypothetical protein